MAVTPLATSAELKQGNCLLHAWHLLVAAEASPQLHTQHLDLRCHLGDVLTELDGVVMLHSCQAWV